MGLFDELWFVALFFVGFVIGSLWSSLCLTRFAHTCHADETDTVRYTGTSSTGHTETGTIHYMECSECGRTYEHVNGDYPHCPHCGKRVVNYEP